MQEIVELNNNTFDEFINKHKIAIVTFYSPTCPACKAAAPVLQELHDSDEYKNKISFGKVNCLEEFDLCLKNKIQGWPNIRLYLKGNYIDRYHSAQELDAYLDWLDDKLSGKEL